MNIRNISKHKKRSTIGGVAYNIQVQWIRHWEALTFLLLITAKMMNYGKSISPEFFDSRYLEPRVIASLLPIVALGYIFKNKGRYCFFIIMNIIISLILFADTVYYRYFTDIISLGAVRNSFLLKGVTASLGQLIKGKDFLYFVDILLYIPINMFIKKVKLREMNIRVRLIIVFFLMALGITLESSYIYKLSKEQPHLITNMSNKLYVAKSLGNLNFHVLDATNFVTNEIQGVMKLPDSRKKEIFNFLQQNNKNNKNAFTGTAKEKNLIIIQVEALQQFVINAKVNGQEITPNLNRWIGKSLYFDNYFYQVGSGNTSDAEFMTNNSLFPAASGAAYYRYTNDTLKSLPHELKEKGYIATVFHGFTQSFWNRNVMYKTEGFDTFFNEQSLNIDEKVGMGLSDKSFFNQSFDKIKMQKQPYYSFLITLSSHFPYDDAKGYGEFDTGVYNNTFLGNYLRAIHYTDSQIGMFLDKLEKEGIANNTIIALYGDHNGITKEYDKELYKFRGINNPTDLNWYELQKVPMLLHFPNDANKGVNHKYVGQMDLYPTIANLFDMSKNYMFGHDVLNNDKQTVVFRNGSFTDGEIFYVSSTNTYYNISSGNVVSETEELKKLKKSVLDKLSYSDDILNHNLLKDKTIAPN